MKSLKSIAHKISERAECKTEMKYLILKLVPRSIGIIVVTSAEYPSCLDD
jgi:hypothetical protein